MNDKLNNILQRLVALPKENEWVEFKHNYPTAGDFLVDKKYTFEVGGKGKSFDQIKDLPNSYLAIDNIEIDRKNRIPMWVFGMMY